MRDLKSFMYRFLKIRNDLKDNCSQVIFTEKRFRHFDSILFDSNEQLYSNIIGQLYDVLSDDGNGFR